MVVTIYEAPSLVALIFKLVLLGYAAKSRAKSALTFVFMAMLIVMSFFNLFEFIGLAYYANNGYDPRVANFFGFSYFVLIVAAIALLLHLSLALSFDGDFLRDRRSLVLLLYAPVVVLEYLLLFTDKLVLGFKPFLYTILRDPGPWYFLFETYLILYCGGALVNLTYGARSSRPILARVRNRLWFLAMAPMAILFIYLVVANHFGWTRLTSTFYGPIAMTFFLAVTTYATYEYRLFDIEFYIPWSKVRKRKTAFYKRIQETIAEIAGLKSVKDILSMLTRALQCQVALIGGARPLVALAPQQELSGRDDLTFSDFPQTALQEINHIIVANEIADSHPKLHGLMKRHKVGAIVPFNSHSSTAAHWMLLGEHFSDHVYTPLDFKVVETLFDRIGERFLENLLLVRSQLAEANDELRDYQRRLGLAWGEIESLRKNLTATEQDNRELREEKANLKRQSFRVVQGGLPSVIASGEKTLEQYLAESEREIVRAALRDCRGNRAKAARLLGVQLRTLHYLIQRHDLERGEVT